MNNADTKKKHSTTMREFRELEKRLLDIQREHNKLVKQRNFYCKSASSNRPYLSERIVAKLRPHTATPGYFKKGLVKETPTNEIASKDIDTSTDFDRQVVDIDQRRIGRSTEGEFKARPFNHAGRYRDVNDWDTKDGKSEIPVARITSSRTCSRNSSANNRNHNRAVSVGSRNSSANSRSLPSEFSHRVNKSWVYEPMSIHPEKQSIYTLVVPPVQMAESSKKAGKKRKRQGGRERHVAWMDNDEHVVRFQGIPRHFYNHEKDQQHSRDCSMEQLKHCRYLR